MLLSNSNNTVSACPDGKPSHARIPSRAPARLVSAAGSTGPAAAPSSSSSSLSVPLLDAYTAVTCTAAQGCGGACRLLSCAVLPALSESALPPTTIHQLVHAFVHSTPLQQHRRVPPRQRACCRHRGTCPACARASLATLGLRPPAAMPHGTVAADVQTLLTGLRNTSLPTLASIAMRKMSSFLSRPRLIIASRSCTTATGGPDSNETVIPTKRSYQ
mgnify:CR=1 FL=1